MIPPSTPNELPNNHMPTSNTVAHVLWNSITVHGFNCPSTVVTQSQTNFSQSSTTTGDEVNATAAIYGDQLFRNSIDNNDLDEITILGRRINLDDNIEAVFFLVLLKVGMLYLIRKTDEVVFALRSSYVRFIVWL